MAESSFCVSRAERGYRTAYAQKHDVTAYTQGVYNSRARRTSGPRRSITSASSEHRLRKRARQFRCLKSPRQTMSSG